VQLGVQHGAGDAAVVVHLHLCVCVCVWGGVTGVDGGAGSGGDDGACTVRA
jgi:hypothetical protein